METHIDPFDKMRLVSSDERRNLYEFGGGGIWKVAKYLEININCTVGGHLHKKKDEMFLLISGAGNFIIGDNEFTRIAPFCFLVPRNTYHVFYLKEDSKLICLASEEHDPDDDYKV